MNGEQYKNPNKDYIRDFVYKYMKENSQYKYYSCMAPNRVNAELCIQSSSSTSTPTCYTCVFLEKFNYDYDLGQFRTFETINGQTHSFESSFVLFKDGYFYKNSVLNYNYNNYIEFYKSPFSKLDKTLIFSNLPFDYDKSHFVNYSTDLLVDTDFYNSSSTDNSSVDMTTTNNLLWTIGLILCVILLLGFLRKIFNRGVK